MVREIRPKAKMASPALTRSRARATATAAAADADAYLGHLLDLALRRVVADLDRVLSLEGVQRDEWRVLEVLRDERGRPMGELAAEVSMNHPTLTKLIDRMVGKSWVQRNIDDEDCRRVLVFITDVGLAVATRLRAPVAEHRRSLQRSLGEQRSRELHRLLASLIAH